MRILKILVIHIIRLVGDEVQVHEAGSWMTEAVIEQLTEPHEGQAQLPSTNGLGDSLMSRDGTGNDNQTTGKVIEQLPEQSDSLQQLISKDRHDDSLQQLTRR